MIITVFSHWTLICVIEVHWPGYLGCSSYRFLSLFKNVYTTGFWNQIFTNPLIQLLITNDFLILSIQRTESSGRLQRWSNTGWLAHISFSSLAQVKQDRQKVRFYLPSPRVTLIPLRIVRSLNFQWRPVMRHSSPPPGSNIDPIWYDFHPSSGSRAKSPGAKHTAVGGSGARASAQKLSSSQCECVFDTGPDWDASETWTASSDECYLERDYRLSLEVEHRFGRPDCSQDDSPVLLLSSLAGRGLWRSGRRDRMINFSKLTCNRQKTWRLDVNCYSTVNY